MKKKIVIATLNDYIVYQPTILNLYDRLAPDFDVEIISFEPEFISKNKDLTRNIRYLKVNPLVKEMANKYDFMVHKASGLIRKIFPAFRHRYIFYNRVLPNILFRSLKNIKDAIVIGVDIPALYVCQRAFGQAHFLSLEIDRSNPFVSKIELRNILSVLIQNKTRQDHLLPGYEGPVFFVQNAPPFSGPIHFAGKRKDFIWAGTLLDRFGVMECIRFFEKYPQYHLVLKGGAEKNTLQKIENNFEPLIRNKVIEINRDYLPGNEFVKFIAGFRIGFCFYSWDLIQNDFNYRTAPSGKLFMYMAAGVPVIACRIPGFQFVEEYGSGVLIEDYEPDTIYAAILKIEQHYEKYQAACYRVAEAFDFNRCVDPYIGFLKQCNQPLP